MAAEQGHAEAQTNLGYRYALGQGVLQSYKDAYAWWAVAAANGNQTAWENLGKAQKYLTPALIEAAQELAKEFMAKSNN